MEVRVFQEDPDLLEGVSSEERPQASREGVARLVRIDAGERHNGELPVRPPEEVALLVLDGLLARRVTVGSRTFTELLGPEGVVCPSRMDDPLVPHTVSWRAVRPTRLALLDQEFARRWPGLVALLLARAERRSAALALHVAIRGLPGVDSRLHVFLWTLAEQFGQVEPAGVSLQLGLTHAELGELVGAHRTSVTSALTALAERGALARTPRGWVLRGSPEDALSGLPG
jgi:CRP/FNR family transcriptional regulator, cyclic AMP receptor protein